jgi:hypothetical protein
VGVKEIHPLLIQIIIASSLTSMEIKKILVMDENLEELKTSIICEEENLKKLYRCCKENDLFRNQMAELLDLKSKNLKELISFLPAHCIEKHFLQYIQFNKQLAGLFLWCLIRDTEDRHKLRISRFSLVLANSFQSKNFFGVC